MIKNYENINLFLRVNPDLKSSYDELKNLLTKYIKLQNDLDKVFTIIDVMVAKKLKLVPEHSSDKTQIEPIKIPTQESEKSNNSSIDEELNIVKKELHDLTGVEIKDDNSMCIVDALTLALKNGTYEQAAEALDMVMDYKILIHKKI